MDNIVVIVKEYKDMFIAEGYDKTLPINKDKNRMGIYAIATKDIITFKTKLNNDVKPLSLCVEETQDFTIHGIVKQVEAYIKHNRFTDESLLEDVFIIQYNTPFNVFDTCYLNPDSLSFIKGKAHKYMSKDNYLNRQVIYPDGSIYSLIPAKNPFDLFQSDFKSNNLWMRPNNTVGNVNFLAEKGVLLAINKDLDVAKEAFKEYQETFQKAYEKTINSLKEMISSRTKNIEESKNLVDYCFKQTSNNFK